MPNLSLRTVRHKRLRKMVIFLQPSLSSEMEEGVQVFFSESVNFIQNSNSKMEVFIQRMNKKKNPFATVENQRRIQSILGFERTFPQKQTPQRCLIRNRVIDQVDNLLVIPTL